jgi:hypothetical protein
LLAEKPSEATKMRGSGISFQSFVGACAKFALPSVDVIFGLTNRWSGRVIDKVPSSNAGARAAQLNR